MVKYRRVMIMDKWVSIGKAAKIIGVSISTLRLWEKRGLLVPDRTPTGHRRYELINAVVIIEYKDRLARFGYAYLSRYIADFAGEVPVVEEKDINEQQELVEDYDCHHNIFFGLDLRQTWRSGCKKTDRYDRKRGVCQ